MLVTISLATGASKALLKYGAADRLQQIYGEHFIAAEAGYDISIQYHLGKEGNLEQAASAIAMLKTNFYSSALLQACESAEAGKSIGAIFDIPLRSTEERMWIKQDSGERVTVIMSVNFVDADDIILGKVFLQEFKKSITGAPPVDFYSKWVDPAKSVPLELKDVKDLPRSPNVCYLTFVLFDRHFKGDKKVKSVQNILNMRNFLHYHIKCAKSHLHTRMRNRVEALLLVLNRAKQETDEDKEKKTAKGRTFTRKE